MPDIGIIACGIAKAGADIVTLSGYDGGTGAARQHALRRAGLPAEIGVAEAHRVLVAAGLRDQVADLVRRRHEERARRREDAVPRRGPRRLRHDGDGRDRLHDLPRLPARHVPRRHRDADHVASAEATEKGLKRFEPQEFERAVQNLMRFFGAMRDELARIASLLGVSTTEELVGRTDLLVQARGLDRVDLSMLLAPAGPVKRGGRELRVLATAGGRERRDGAAA